MTDNEIYEQIKQAFDEMIERNFIGAPREGYLHSYIGQPVTMTDLDGNKHEGKIVEATFDDTGKVDFKVGFDDY